MVRVYKDIMNFLKIENLFIKGEKNYFCNLIEIGKEQWIVAIDSDIIDNQAILNIKINGKYIEVPIVIEKINPLYSLKFKDRQKNKHFIKLQSKIKELEENHEKWEKRKEERYTIAEENVKKFYLSSATQILVKNKIQLPCYLNNISFNGANITTIMTEKTVYHIGNEIILILKFTEPIEQIYLKAYIQSIVLKTAKNTTHYKFAILSLQLIEPPFSYKTRLGNYINKTGE